MSRFNRRSLLLGAAALPLIPLSSLAASPAAKVDVCGWCDDPKQPSPENHPDGTPEHVPAKPVAARMQAEIEQERRRKAEAEGWRYYEFEDAALDFDLPSQPGDLTFPTDEAPGIIRVQLRHVLLQINPHGSGILWYDHIWGPKAGLELINAKFNDEFGHATTTGLLRFIDVSDPDVTKTQDGVPEFELRRLSLMFTMLLRNVYRDNATPEEAKVLDTRQASLSGSFHFGEVIDHSPHDLDFDNYEWGAPVNWADDELHLEALTSPDKHTTPYWDNGYGRALVMTPQWQQKNLPELRTIHSDYLKGANVTLLDTQDGKMYVVPHTWAIERDWQVQYIDARKGGGANVVFHPLTAAQSYFYSQHFCPCHRKQAAEAAGAVVLGDECEGKRFLIYKVEHRDLPGLILYSEVMTQFDLITSLQRHCKQVTG